MTDVNTDIIDVYKEQVKEDHYKILINIERLKRIVSLLSYIQEDFDNLLVTSKVRMQGIGEKNVKTGEETTDLSGD